MALELLDAELKLYRRLVWLPVAAGAIAARKEAILGCCASAKAWPIFGNDRTLY